MASRDTVQSRRGDPLRSRSPREKRKCCHLSQLSVSLLLYLDASVWANTCVCIIRSCILHAVCWLVPGPLWVCCIRKKGTFLVLFFFFFFQKEKKEIIMTSVHVWMLHVLNQHSLKSWGAREDFFSFFRVIHFLSLIQNAFSPVIMSW